MDLCTDDIGEVTAVLRDTGYITRTDPGIDIEGDHQKAVSG